MNDKAKIALLYEEVKSKIPTKNTTPDNLVFDGISLSWNRGLVTFAFFGENLDKVAYSDKRTHPFIFNSLQGAKNEIDTGASLSDLKRHFKDYDTKLAGKPTEDDIKIFMGKTQWNQELGRMRANTRAGRIWKNVPSQTLKKNFDVIVFWCNQKDITEKELSKLKELFKLDDVIYCGLNSSYFLEYNGSENSDELKEEPEVREFKSKLFPQLTHFDIVKILVKAHTNPSKLNAAERKVVDEFRGDAKVVFAEYGGYPSKAEFEYRKKLSEAIENEQFHKRI
jgi:hypothetical protein